MLEPRFFEPQLRKVVEDDDLPDYHITMSFDPQARELLEEDGVDTRRWASNDRILIAFCRAPSVAPELLATDAAYLVLRSRPRPRRHGRIRYFVHAPPSRERWPAGPRGRAHPRTMIPGQADKGGRAPPRP